MIDLINELEENKIQISLDGEDLELSFDSQDISLELVDKVKTNKKELLSFLKRKNKTKLYDDIPVIESKEYYPISHNQKRIWILNQFEGGSVVWNMPVTIKLKGEYSVEIFQEALENIIERHEILRTVFVKKEDGEVYQKVLTSKEFNFHLNYLDLKGRDNAIIKAEEYINKDSSLTFNLEKGPLLRCSLLRIDNNEYLFYLNIHHIISDGWSLEVLQRDIMAMYKASEKKEVVNLPNLPIQYKDFTSWQLNQLNNAIVSKEAKYWKNELVTPLPSLNLPTLKKRPKILTYNGGHYRTYLGKETTKKLREFCKENGGSLFMLLLANWNVLFHRYLGQKDIIIGTLVAGRDHPDLENQVGYYVNTLALRNKIEPESSFLSFYQKVKDKTINAFEHQMYPFDNLLEELDVERDVSRTPIFDVLLVLHNIKEGAKEYENLNKNQIEDISNLGKNFSKFPLEIEFKELGDYISFDIKFNSDIYEESFIKNCMIHYKKLINELLLAPQKKINKVEFLTEEERYRLLYTFNSNKGDYPKNKRVIDFFKEQVFKTPNKVSVVYEKTKLTFQELDKLSDEYATILSGEYGLKSGQNIVVSLSHDCDLMAILLAVMKIGAIYIPVDPKSPNERVNYISELSSSVNIIDKTLLNEIKRKQVVLEEVKTNWDKEVNSEIEFIIYTSGSTGVPKGVLIKTSSVNNRLNWMWKKYPFEKDEVCCAKTSISFVDHIWEFFGPLLKGIPLVFYRKEDIIDIPSFIESLGEEKITRIVLVPSLLRAILEFPELCRVKLENLRVCISSGETLKKRDVSRFYKVLKRNNVRLINIYGSTEVTADATYYDTYNDYFTESSFKLFNTTIRDSVNELIEQQDSSLKIVSSSLNELLENDNFQKVDFSKGINEEKYIEFLKKDILPNVVNVASPNYIGHMTGPVPEFIREINALIVALNQNQVKIETSLVATLIENQVIGTFHKLVFEKEPSFYEEYVQSPEEALGVITNGGTMSNIMAMSYALNNSLKPKEGFRGISEEGLMEAMKAYEYEKVVIIGSEWCHYSFGKALKILGLGKKSFVPISFEDKTYEELKDELRSKIKRLREERTLILSIIGVAGTTESGNIDPLKNLGEIAAEFNIHYHVDAAFGGSFLMDDSLKLKFEGIQMADTVSICAHKQLYIPIGLSLCLFKDIDFASFSENNTHYQARKGSYDLGKYTVEGSRNFMSLTLHAIFHVLGKEGFAEVVKHNYNTAQYFAELVEKSVDFELVLQPDLNIVLYRYIPEKYRGKLKFTEKEIEELNELNEQIQNKQFEEGNTFVSYTKIKNKENSNRHLVFRTVFMNPFTNEGNLEAVLDEQRQIAFSIENKAEFEEIDERGTVPIGIPIENVKVFILDEYLNILPIGVVGEICISGDCVSEGYINLSKEESSRFIDSPFEKEEKLFKTGDLGRRLEDGNIEFISRKDDQVKIRGNRVELGEVENNLQKHKKVKNAVVVPKEIDNGEVFLVGYFESSIEISSVELRNFMKEFLPDYMIPQYFVKLDKIPLTTSGKINKQELPNVDYNTFQQVNNYVAPRNDIEIKLVDIWKRVLKKEKVSVYDDFFVLGGHSLKATNLINEYQKIFNVKLGINEIFLNTTLYSHISLLNKAPKSNYLKIEKVIEKESYALSGSQKRLWIASQFSNSSASYNMPFSIELNEISDIEIFRKAIVALVERHEILRTIFKENEQGELSQWVLPKETLSFEIPCFDYSDQDYAVDKVKELIKEDSYQDFDLEKGPLFRVMLFKINDNKYIFYYNMHHIIGDGVSLEIIKRDVLSYYNAFIKNEVPQLPDLTVQYKDYAEWQNSKNKSEEFKEYSKFWRQKLNGKLTRLKFPGEKSRPKTITHDGRNLYSYIDSELTNDLRKICKANGATLYVGILTVWKILFLKYTNQTDIIIGTPVAGRYHDDLKNQIGCYINTIVLRDRLNFEETFIETFEKIKKNVLESFENQEYPFEKIVEDLEVSRLTDRNAIFDVMFSFHNTAENIKEKKVYDTENIEDRGNVQVKLDLLINFAEEGNFFYMDIDYNTSIFESSFVRKMMRDYKCLLRELINEPNKKLRDIDFEEEQRNQLKQKRQQKLKNLLK
ncbi:condensation domain-containing protein [Tenacibaculum singaporense]|uniref:condensation domain-containing protein n=1 Tax=Tenacibaculum singaporense TaxID=2358479 RepID=UPI000F66D58F|nr:condensation domain-containing protein [Tenacibaculum singaporense]RSC93316.1 aminotransferase class V-fold PLP-dependent enzyme [Tenacibaculum singaporense]